MIRAQQPPHSDPISTFVHRVDQACSDLPTAQRRQILADLDAHLREMEGRSDLLTELGDPDQYARDLRLAMNLPMPTAATRTPKRRWLATVALVGVAALAVVAVFAIKAATTSQRPGQPNPPATTAQRTQPIVTVPYLVGMTQAEAIAQLKRQGLTPVVQRVTVSALPPGVVAAQIPAAYTLVPPGMQITLRVANGH